MVTGTGMGTVTDTVTVTDMAATAEAIIMPMAVTRALRTYSALQLILRSYLRSAVSNIGIEQAGLL